MRWPRANLEEKQEPRAATSASAERREEGIWHDVTRKGLTEDAIEKPTFGRRPPPHARHPGPATLPTMLRLALLLTLLPALALADVTGPPRVIDGDTIEVAGERIRLHGIDAPESRQTCRRDGTTWLCGAEGNVVIIGPSALSWPPPPRSPPPARPRPRWGSPAMSPLRIRRPAATWSA